MIGMYVIMYKTALLCPDKQKRSLNILCIFAWYRSFIRSYDYIHLASVFTLDRRDFIWRERPLFLQPSHIYVFANNNAYIILSFQGGASFWFLRKNLMSGVIVIAIQNIENKPLSLYIWITCLEIDMSRNAVWRSFVQVGSWEKHVPELRLCRGYSLFMQ